MDKLRMTSPDLTAANIDRLAELFPNVITEKIDADGNVTRAVDFDLLRQELSDHIVEGPQERYRLDWPGKRAAAFAANAPIAKTLRPVREESVNFDTTKNLFIEGDNLDALKLLQESYLGKIKLIYIDPPYNTGHDFIYDDDFAESTESYLQRSGQIDDAGLRLVTNSNANGRYHSNWLSMMYPRLKLARNLLTEDGFIVVSIDDAEISTLEILLDEIMGQDNKLAVVVWDRNRKNDARYFSVGHEYMFVYARNKTLLTKRDVRLREPQQGLQEAREKIDQLRSKFGDDTTAIQAKWREWTKSFSPSDARRKLGRFSKVGPRGPYRDDGDISWPGGGGPRYEVIHPVTGRPCKTPSRGWVFPTKERFDQAVMDGRVVFGHDDSTQPRIVSYLFESSGLAMSSVQYSYAQTAAVDFKKLMKDKVFDNPKNWKDLRRIISYLTESHDIVMDFFAGSASTAHAVLDLNASEGSKRSYILVQIDERVPENSLASKAGYKSIDEIARDRIARVEQIYDKNEAEGFRFLKIDSSCFSEILRNPDATDQLILDDLSESIMTDRSAEDLLFQVILDWGLELTMPIHSETIDGHEILSVDDDALIACFDREVTLTVVREMAHRQPLRAVFRDDGFPNDAARINAEQIFRGVSPSTDVKAI